MVGPMPVVEPILVALALVAGSWGGRLFYLHRTHLRALARAGVLAERICGPANSLEEMEQQSLARQKLVQLRDAQAAVTAARELLPDLRAEVRGAALEVLRKTRALERWMQNLQTGAPVVRLRAIEALGEVGDERAIDALIAVLGDEDPEIAAAAGRAVLARDRDYATDRLGEALSSPVARKAKAAADVLVSLGEEGVEPFLTQLTALAPSARRLALDGLRAVGDARCSRR